MIENNTKFEILNQKAENIEKVRQRFFTIVLILPIIFSRTEKFNATFIHKVWFGFQFSAKFWAKNCL